MNSGESDIKMFREILQKTFPLSEKIIKFMMAI